MDFRKALSIPGRAHKSKKKESEEKETELGSICK